MKHISRFFGVFLMVFVTALPVQAQQCTPVKESIMNFEAPAVGSYNLWDATFGTLEQREEFVSGFMSRNGNVVVGGHRFGNHKSDMSLMVSALDRRGREDWAQEHKIDGVDRIYKLLPVGDGFWAIGRQSVTRGKKTVRQAWIGMFDGEGQLQSEAVVAEKNEDIVPTDIVPTHDGKGFILSVKLTVNGSEKIRGSRVYFLSSKGKVVSMKSFLFGLENLIQKMTPLDGGKYAVVGRIRDTHRRWAGWIMVLNKDGGIEWQREYSRGSAASLDFVDEQKSGDIVVSGIARPAIKDGDRGGWVMAVSAAGGDIVWQRYYIGKSNYVGRSLIAHPDGLVSVLLGVSEKDGTQPTPEFGGEQRNYSHARLLTLSPRGQIFTENTYFNGVAADPYDMFLGKNNERVIVGRSKVGYTIEASEENAEPIVEYSQDLWAVAGAPPDPYTDPCESFISFLP